MSTVVRKACCMGRNIAIHHRLVTEVWAAPSGWSMIFPQSPGYVERRRHAEDKGLRHIVTFKPKAPK